MKKLLLAAALVCAAGFAAFGQAQDYQGPRFSLTVGFQPLGSFIYTRTDGYEYVNMDPMINTSFIFEYRFASDVGIGGYFDVRGYKWHTITESDPLFGRIYGAPGFTAGAMGFWHFLPASFPLDICLAGGVGLKVYVESAGVFSGLDLSSVLDVMYRFTNAIAAGIRGGLSYSMHPGGEEQFDPSVTRAPFDLVEYNVGVIVRIGF
jgi:hypothetical protein